jgi:REP element-mobilizing transposase RayT
LPARAAHALLRTQPATLASGREEPICDLAVVWIFPAVIVATLRKTDDLKNGKRFRFVDRELDGAVIWTGVVARSENCEDRCCPIDAVAHAGLCLIHAFVVMPDHVHPLLEPKVDLKRITQGIKGRSARACNLALKRTGERFWQEESCDHGIRNPSSFEKIRTYIKRHPVSAGLANTPKEWQWSSAFR